MDERKVLVYLVVVRAKGKVLFSHFHVEREGGAQGWRALVRVQLLRYVLYV